MRRASDISTHTFPIPSGEKWALLFHQIGFANLRAFHRAFVPYVPWRFAHLTCFCVLRAFASYLRALITRVARIISRHHLRAFKCDKICF